MNPTLRTIALFSSLTLLMMGVGFIMQSLWGVTYGMLAFLMFAVVINLITYFYSSKIVLAMYRARFLKDNEMPDIHRLVEYVALQAGVPKPRIAIVPTRLPNAFATGRNPKNAVIALTEGIISALNERELKAVIGHEMGHIKDRDILVMTIAATVTSALSIAARIVFWQSLFSRDREQNVFLYLIAIAGAAIAAVLIQMAISRQREFKADEQSARFTNDPEALISALQKLELAAKRQPLNGNPATSSLFIVNPFRGSAILTLFATHPPVEERIKRLKEFEFNGLVK